MKNLLYLFIAASFIACAPNKRDTPTYVDIYCDTCNIVVKNETKEFSETVFSGSIIGYKRIELFRFEGEYSCVKSYSTDEYTENISGYLIENNDSLYLPNGGNGFCY